MTAIGINAASAQMQAGSFVSVTMNQVSISGNTDFSSVLAKRLNSANDNASEIRTYSNIKPQKTEYNRNTAEQSSDEATAAEKRTATETQETAGSTVIHDNEADAAQKTPKGKESQVGEVQDGQTSLETATIDEDSLQVMEVLVTLLQNVAGLLQTTVGELTDKLEELQLEPAEMFTDKGLQQLVISTKGLTDNSDFLVDRDALDVLNSLQKLVEETFTQLGIEPQEFTESEEGNLFTAILNTQLKDEIGAADPAELVKRAIVKLQENETEGETEAPDMGKTFEGPVVEVTYSKASAESENGNTEHESTDEQSNASAETVKTDTRSDRRSSTTVVTGAENFVKGLENAMKAVGMDTQVAEGVTVRDVVYQLTDAIKVNITPENTSLEMHLTPENLGRVSLSIQSKDGVMTAQITTENQVSKEALESQLQILKENIESQGVKVEAIEVTISNFSFLDSKNAEGEENEPTGRSGRSRRGGISTDEIDENEIEAETARLEREVMEQNGSTVNYVA